MAIDPQQIELNDEQRKALARVAEQTGRPWSEVLSEALRRSRPSVSPSMGQEPQGSPYDALKSDGLIGIVISPVPVEVVSAVTTNVRSSPESLRLCARTPLIPAIVKRSPFLTVELVVSHPSVTRTDAPSVCVASVTGVADAV